jgi:hypothetical protein
VADVLAWLLNRLPPCCGRFVSLALMAWRKRLSQLVAVNGCQVWLSNAKPVATSEENLSIQVSAF